MLMLCASQPSLVFTVTGSHLEGSSAFLVDSLGGVVYPTSVTVDEGGSTAEIAFAAGLRKTVEWYLANRDWCARAVGRGDGIRIAG